MMRYVTLAFALTTMCVRAADVPKTAPEHTIVRIKVLDGESLSVIPVVGQGMNADVDVDGDLFRMTGPPGQYLLCEIRAEVTPSTDSTPSRVKVTQRYHELTIVAKVPPTPPDPNPPEPDPPKPPDPKPDLTEHAKAVFQKAVELKQPGDAARLAAVFEATAKKIETRELLGRDAIQESLVSANRALQLSSAWKPFGEWLAQLMRTNAQTVQSQHDLCVQIAAGLRAAAGAN